MALRIQLVSSDGVHLESEYIPSRNGIVVIIAGGTAGSTGNSLPPVDFLVKEGYGVFRLGSRACAIPPATVTLGGKEILDVEAAIDYLRSHSEIKHIAAFGFSMGGATIIRAARLYPDIEAVIAEGGYFNLGKDIVEKDPGKTAFERIFVDFVPILFWLQTRVNPWTLSPIDDLPKISPRPVFLIYGDREAGSGHAAEQFLAARNPKTLWIVTDGDHGTNYATAPGEYEKRVLKFLAEAFEQ